MNNLEDKFYEDDKIIKGYEQDLLILREKLDAAKNEFEKEEYKQKIELIESVLNSMKG